MRATPKPREGGRRTTTTRCRSRLRPYRLRTRHARSGYYSLAAQFDARFPDGLLAGLLSIALALSPFPAAHAAAGPASGVESSITRADVVVYGATPAGIAAAVAADRAGASVVLLEHGTHIGGMMASGLGHTDVGDKRTIGGLAAEVFKRIGAKYGGGQTFHFQPHIGSEVFHELLAETDVLVAVPNEQGSRVAELQLLVLHCLCDAVDFQLLGDQAT